MRSVPELPEVENVCRGLTERLVGQTVARVMVRRPDVITGPGRPSDLLRGCKITAVERLGKQLALVGQTTARQTNARERCVCVHLGMSGSLRIYRPNERLKQDTHTHVIWYLTGGGRLTFRDPRRFGGLWTFCSVEALWTHRWFRLGEDALRITPRGLHKKLARTGRAIKAVLLDQAVLAGLGNIYVDEILFACGIHPLAPGRSVTMKDTARLVRQMRSILRRAVRAGGSTLRDYTGATGQPGGFQLEHKVYGRAGALCVRCRTRLSSMRIAGRTSVFCPKCQPEVSP